jgi:sec-independent protein translocase protein TatA
MFGQIGWQEILVILFLLLLLFGAKRLPELGQSLGKGIREFKRGIRDIQEDVEQEDRKIKKD